MRPCRRVLFVVLSALMSLGLGGAVGVSAASAVPSRFTCTGTVTPFAPELIPPGTYALLSMPAGSLCYVADASVGGGAVTVNHGLTLGEASLLPLTGGSLTVNGPLTVGDNAWFGDYSAPFGPSFPITVNGPLTVDSHGAAAVYAGAIAGPVVARDASGLQIDGTSLTLPLLPISGPVSVIGGGGNNAVLDELGFFGQNYLDLELDNISGPLSITGYDGAVVYLGGDHTGPMTFSDNTATPSPYWSPPLFFSHYMVINGPGTCADNTPNPIGRFNTVNGPVRGDQGTACFG